MLCTPNVLLLKERINCTDVSPGTSDYGHSALGAAPTKLGDKTMP